MTARARRASRVDRALAEIDNPVLRQYIHEQLDAAATLDDQAATEAMLMLLAWPPGRAKSGEPLN
jgi:hypothetical protein